MIEPHGIPTWQAFHSLWAPEEVEGEHEDVPMHSIGDPRKPEDLAVDHK